MSFRIDFEWMDRQFGTALDKAAFAQIKVYLHGHLLTEVYDKSAKNVRDYLAVSAWDLAEWIVANWWRLRWETETNELDASMSHSLPAVGGGYIWPDIRFSSDWNTVLVDAFPFEAKTAPLRFISEKLHLAVPVAEFEKELDTFVSAVFSRVRESDAARDERVQGLFTLWDELQEERRDKTLAYWRKLEAIAGYDPGEAPDMFYGLIPDAEKKWGRNAVEELLAEGRHHTRQLFADIENMTGKHGATLSLEGIPEAVGKNKSARNASTPAEAGHEAARILRQQWSLGFKPLTSTAFSDHLGLSGNFLKENKSPPNSPIDFGFRKTDGVRCVIRGKWETSRRFAMARLLGDCLYSPKEDHLLPLTKAKTARQKFQRAFAQELLCPLEGVQEILANKSCTEERVEMAASHFNVSPMTIHSTLVNRLGYSRDVLLKYEEFA